MVLSEHSIGVALVTPFNWALPSAVNTRVADLARALHASGHRPVVVVSTDDPDELGRARLLCRRRCALLLELLEGWQGGAVLDPRLLPVDGSGALRPAEQIPVIPLGRSIPLRLNGSVTNIGLPIDLRSRLERLLTGGDFAVVHVHEPVAPSLSFTAVREARSPVLATFHLSPLGLLGYELGRSFLERFYERLDVRMVSSPGAAEALAELFPGAYEVVPLASPLGGEERPDGPRSTSEHDGRLLLYVYRGDDRRGMRAFLRAFRHSEPARSRRLLLAIHRRSAELWPPRAVPRGLRSRVEWHAFDTDEDLGALYRRASAVVLPYLGGDWLETGIVECRSTGRPFAAPDLPAARQMAGADGTFFSPQDEESLSRALAHLVARPGSPSSSTPDPISGTGEGPPTMDRMCRQVVGLYEQALGRGKGRARREAPVTTTATRTRGPVVAPDGWIHADLHIHTEYSKDCVSPVEQVLATARDVGLGAVAIADHDTVAGGLAAREAAPPDLIVIVAEEVKTTCGEVIGLFLEEDIPGGLSFEETLTRIKAQGGLVYIPHPFDRLRTTPSYQMMVENLHRIDAVETYNARVFHSSFNVNAERFAAKYRLPAGAGSDAHVLPGIGTALLRMPRFDGPEEFLAGLREADIVTRRKRLLYVQSLKLLQNTLDHVLPVNEAREGRR